MAGTLEGLRVAFLVANEGTEQIELTEPWDAVKREGGSPTLVSLEPGEAALFNHLDRADTWPVDVTVDRTRVDDYHALVLPGGVANPDQLRTSQPAVEFVRGFVESGKPIAVICHGPWTLIEADVVRGRTLTSWPSLRTDIGNAGGEWVDREVVVSEQPSVIVSSRKPADLPAFISTFVEQFARQAAGAR
ncbi:MAG TPA: type 1 glutamine amidotransferase domain-containing protein [Natronosporangium sp.]